MPYSKKPIDMFMPLKDQEVKIRILPSAIEDDGYMHHFEYVPSMGKQNSRVLRWAVNVFDYRDEKVKVWIFGMPVIDQLMNAGSRAMERDVYVNKEMYYSSPFGKTNLRFAKRPSELPVENVYGLPYQYELHNLKAVSKTYVKKWGVDQPSTKVRVPRRKLSQPIRVGRWLRPCMEEE